MNCLLHSHSRRSWSVKHTYIQCIGREELKNNNNDNIIDKSNNENHECSRGEMINNVRKENKDLNIYVQTKLRRKAIEIFRCHETMIVDSLPLWSQRQSRFHSDVLRCHHWLFSVWIFEKITMDGVSTQLDRSKQRIERTVDASPSSSRDRFVRICQNLGHQSFYRDYRG